MTSRDVIHSFYRARSSASSRTSFPAATPRPGSRRPSPAATSILLHRVLRHLALADVGRGRGAGRADFDVWLAEQSGRGWPSGSDTSGGAESARRPSAGDLVELRPATGRGARLPEVPLARRAAAHRPDLGRSLSARKTVLETGETIVADEAYLTESMMEPYVKMVKGYKPRSCRPSRGSSPPRRRPRWSSSSSRSGATALENVPAKEADL